MAGVTRSEEWIRQKLYQAKCRANAAFIFSSFFEKAFVSRVNLRSCILTVRFCRSMCEVEIRRGFGFPIIGIGTASTLSDGLYRSRFDSSPLYTFTNMA